MRRFRQPAAWIAPSLAIALIAAACTSGPQGPADPNPAEGFTPGSPQPAVATPSPLPPPPAWAGELAGRLLIVDESGGLSILEPDGTDPLVLVEGDPEQPGVVQATWSPDGSAIAWSEVTSADGLVVPQIVLSAPDGDGSTRVVTPVASFYLAWDPTSSRVAFLGNGDRTIQMGVVELDAGAGSRVTTVDAGAPYYLSWSPGGDRLLVHVGGDRLDEIGLDGVATSLRASPGLFQAPVWTPDGETHLFVEATGRGDNQRLVARDAGSSKTTVLAKAQGVVSFATSPDGSRLAFQALSQDEQALYDRDLPARATDVGVTVVDVASGRTVHISDTPAVAWTWSPDGSRLAILEAVYEGVGRLLFRWQIWDGGRLVETPQFPGSLGLLRDYAPFFGQFEQSTSMWSPDSSAIAFPIEMPDGAAVIRIQPVSGNEEPFTLAPGRLVAWSPVG